MFIDFEGRSDIEALLKMMQEVSQAKLSKYMTI